MTSHTQLNPNANMAALDSLLMGLSVTHELSTAGSGKFLHCFLQCTVGQTLIEICTKFIDGRRDKMQRENKTGKTISTTKNIKIL